MEVYEDGYPRCANGSLRPVMLAKTANFPIGNPVCKHYKGFLFLPHYRRGPEFLGVADFRGVSFFPRVKICLHLK